jgi:protein O-GlcNAc transferase
MAVTISMAQSYVLCFCRDRRFKQFERYDIAMQELADGLNRALAHQHAGQFAEAEREYHAVLQQRDDVPDAWNLLGVVVVQQGRAAEAVELLQRAITLRPNDASFHVNHGIALQQTGQPQAAIASYQRAIHLDPRSSAAYVNLAESLQTLGKHDEASAALDTAISLTPDNALAHYGKAKLLFALDRAPEALGVLTQSHLLNSNFAWAYVIAGHCLRKLASPDAHAMYERAMTLDPTITVAWDNLLMQAHYSHEPDQRSFERHLEYGRQFEAPLAPKIQPHANEPEPNRLLRVGYVSADFFHHPVGLFLEPVLAELPRDQFHVTCYNVGWHDDELTARLRNLSDQWRDVRNSSDDQIAQRIRNDHIDILVDLSGHTADNRLLVFAHKPAPVLVTHFAYPDTTGLRAIDYRITDALADPPGATEKFHTETLVRLPNVAWCYRPFDLDRAPDIVSPPLVSRGHVTFGCLNNPLKLSDPARQIFTQILAAVPQSKLVLRLFRDENARRRIIDSVHIDPGRLVILPPVPRLDYLLQYNQIDIALDPFPYNGGVTTCDALLMGVPVITLAGRAYVSRQGLSVLTNLGLNDLIANSPGDYVRIAKELGANRGRLTTLRSQLRSMLQASPIMDVNRYAHDLAAAYRQMWRNWCDKPHHIAT